MTSLLDEITSQLRFAPAETTKLDEEKRLARTERFAAHSEQHPQSALFNEAEQEQATVQSDTETIADEITVPANSREVAKRKPLSKDLPRKHRLNRPTGPCDRGQV